MNATSATMEVDASFVVVQVCSDIEFHSYVTTRQVSQMHTTVQNARD